MKRRWKPIVRDVTPPILLRHGLVAMRKLRRLLYRQPGGEEPSERDSKYYDRQFKRQLSPDLHYTKSPYYFLWAVIADRLAMAKVRMVLDIGCGVGGLATLLRDQGLEGYCGVDFSPVRLAEARKICPEFRFVEADAFKTDLFKTVDYDAVLSLEFLEHVERDIEILNKIKSGVRFIGTVPNFPHASHVRHFQDIEEVRTRYQHCFEDLRVDWLVEDEQRSKTFYLLDGLIR